MAKIIVAILEGLFGWKNSKQNSTPKKKETSVHEHDWEFQYSTGNPTQGKSQVSKCACGQWGVRHYGQKEINLIDNG